MNHWLPSAESCFSDKTPFQVNINKVLRPLSNQESFYFYEAYDSPIGEKADSLADFVRKIKKIDNLSLAFHYYRGDFGRWARDVIGDPVLAHRLSVRGRITLKGEELRTFIIKQIRTRLDDLKVDIR